jgi:hypothetical protein
VQFVSVPEWFSGLLQEGHAVVVNGDDKRANHEKEGEYGGVILLYWLKPPSYRFASVN